MTVHVHTLGGCAPQPLAHYLKGVAVLRLLHEQADPTVRAAWRGDQLVLCSTLDRDALLGFFLEQWSPTPLVDPWNGGSGFYPKDKSAREKGVEPIVGSDHPRFAAYREAIADCRRRVEGLTERPSGDDKVRLLTACRNEWSSELLDWFRAAVVRLGDKPAYPALLGTGGNDGRLDYCANFMQRLADLFDDGRPRPASGSLLGGALFGTATDGLSSAPVGQYLPGGAGGANASQGFDATALVNPWDFVLMLEGAAGIPVAAVRALDAQGPPQAAAPFAVQATAAGFGTATLSEESARGEQWMPLWDRLCTWPEVAALFREGRMTLGDERARRAVDAAQAIGRRGVAQGIAAFQRFAFIERNGQSNLAVPVGRFVVKDRPELALLDQVMPWVRRLRRASSKAPEGVLRDLGRIEDAVMELCRVGGPHAWQAVLGALASAEDGLVRRPRFVDDHRLRPIPRLDTEWALRAAEADGSAEMRLASALASAHWPGRWDPHSGVRGHCVPLHQTNHSTFDPQSSVRVVWQGRDLVDDLVRIVRRRAVEGARDGANGLPLVSQVSARLPDIAAFLLGAVDEARIASLARGLMAVRWSSDGATALARRLGPTEADPPVVPAPWAAVRLVYGPAGSLGDRRSVLDPRPLALLAAGRITEGVEAAARRLAANGIRPKARTAIGDATLSKRFVAALAFPLARRHYAQLLRVAGRVPETLPVVDGPTTEESP